MTPYLSGDTVLLPFVSYTIQFPIIVGLFFLSCWADPPPLYKELDSQYHKWI